MGVKVAFILAATALMASAATAAPTTFSGTYEYQNNSGDGLITTIQNATGGTSLDATAPGNRTFAFSLNEGESRLFDLFDIFTMENSAEADDYIPRAISVAEPEIVPDSGAMQAGFFYFREIEERQPLSRFGSDP